MNDPYWLLGAIAILLALNLSWILVSSRTSRQLLLDVRGETEDLKQQSLKLKDELEAQKELFASEFQFIFFEQLQGLLTQYPTVIKIVEYKPDFPAKDILPLFVPLNGLIELWKYKVIGSPWEQVYYDPKYHQADCNDMRVGELVYIRFVGYYIGDRILVPAKVSRTLPISNQSHT